MYKLRQTVKENPVLNRSARKILSIAKKYHPARSSWKFEPNFKIFSDYDNLEAAELNSGIQEKIAAIKLLGTVEIIGGITTGGNDDLFKMEPEIGYKVLGERMESAVEGTFFIFHVPHPFLTRVFGKYFKWLPSWDDLYHFIYLRNDWMIFQYSPTFDASGRFFFIAQKKTGSPRLKTLSELSQRTYRVFYYREGAQPDLGRSNFALSANLCAAISLLGANVHAYDMTDIGAIKQCHPDDVLIGHVGPWVKEAHNYGCKNIILFNPSNQWYPTRNSNFFENNASIEEQVALAKMVIAQSGSIWRLTANTPTPEKWRWIDLGIDRKTFPRLKFSFNFPGKRRFLFFHLYDNDQKGADIAEELIQNNPSSKFVWLDCVPFQAKNIKSYPSMPNTGNRFRRIVSECDFILVPSREDAQPGTLIEAVSLGLIASASYSSGYSFSFPSLVIPNTVDKWQSTIDYLQIAGNSELNEASVVFQHYVNYFHNWDKIHSLILLYLREALS